MATGYRRIDIDSLHPQNFEDTNDSELSLSNPILIIFHVFDDSSEGPDEQNIRRLLAENLLEEALRTALESPPKRTDQEKKMGAIRLIIEVLVSFKSNDIGSAVQKLSVEEGDILMNYVYKAMEMEQEPAVSHILLGWHSQVFARFGHGAVVRVFSERLIL